MAFIGERFNESTGKHLNIVRAIIVESSWGTRTHHESSMVGCMIAAIGSIHLHGSRFMMNKLNLKGIIGVIQLDLTFKRPSEIRWQQPQPAHDSNHSSGKPQSRFINAGCGHLYKPTPISAEADRVFLCPLLPIPGNQDDEERSSCIFRSWLVYHIFYR